MIVFSNKTPQDIRQAVLAKAQTIQHRKRTALVEGVGVNDATFMTSCQYVNASGQKKVWHCPLYQVWHSMLMRCYNQKYLATSPTYAGCSVHSDWHSFVAFRKWMLTQDWDGNQLDKDILVPGNKVYSKDTCVFIPGSLNNFLTGDKSVGKYLTGVDPRGRKVLPFTARICDAFGKGYINLGHYATELEAHEAWKKKKHELACIWATKVTDPRVAKALMTRYL